MIKDLINRVVGWLNAVPYWLLALPLRLAVAHVFWASGTLKLEDWSATLGLFRDEYRLPLIPPELAAPMAAAVELSMPVLLILGLATRPAACVLLGMILVIQTLVYPESWPDHIQWGAMLVVLLCRGAGTLSLDTLLARRFGGAGPARLATA
jgi:putative oxidoreductase